MRFISWKEVAPSCFSNLRPDGAQLQSDLVALALLLLELVCVSEAGTQWLVRKRHDTDACTVGAGVRDRNVLRLALTMASRRSRKNTPARFTYVDW